MIVAYLAPEIPALTATFVHEELLAVERRGVGVIPVCVRAPSQVATDQPALAQRTHVLYRRSPWLQVACGATAALGFGRRGLVALRWLLHDIRVVGPSRPASWKLAYQWLAAARLGRLLQREGCAHLHVHFAHVPAQIGMYASAFTGIPFTITAHANDIFERGALLVEKATRARKLLTISRYNLDHLRSLGVPEEKLAIVRCGISFATRGSAPRREARPRHRVGSLGRLIEKKGLDVLLRAVALAAADGCDVELSVVGEGPLRGPLETLARDLGLHDRVRFEGALPHDAIQGWLATLDVFALACTVDTRGDMDGIPVALMEAMSQRVPVLSTRLSGIPELVIDGTTGLLVPPAHPPALAAALRRLLDAPDLRERLTSAAVRHLEAEFGQRINVDRLMKYFPSFPGDLSAGREARCEAGDPRST